MRALVEGFVHRPGLHCGSTALADVLRHAGLDWSEPMVFGLASGPWFLMLRADGMTPSRFFVGRTGLFEQHFTHNTGIEIAEKTTRDVGAAIAEIKASIAAGTPVLLKADIRYLPYYATETEFNGHKIACAGFDEEADEVYVADTHFEGLQAISFRDLERTLTSTGAPTYFPDCVYGPVRRNANEHPLAEAVRRSLRTAAEHMIKDPSELGGLDSLDAFAAEVATWRAQSDASWISRFGYQVIEKRGTGGGLFRRLYTRFLEEAGAPASQVEAMRAIADRWTSIAGHLKRASEGANEAWDAAGAEAREVAARERAFFEEVAR